ncbi:kinase-like domain-containing protein [Haematococcus lacustris]
MTGVPNPGTGQACRQGSLLAYELQTCIGTGSGGRAFLAIRKEDGERVVIKQVPFTADFDQKAREDALHEARTLSQFDHVNIIHYYETILEDHCLSIVMEYASQGDLSALITQRAAEKKPFAEDDVMFWFVQIVLALYHVHSKNILHRDLKSSNVFVSEGNVLKLGDFGIARVLNSDTELARTAGQACHHD